jgi:iron uptake system component EfeO
MNFLYLGDPGAACQGHSRPAHRAPACVSRGVSWLSTILRLAALGIGLVPAGDARAASLDEGVENYRTNLVADVDRTLASAQKLRANAAAGDLAAAKQAWLEARVGWERSEIFTTGFVPELDRDIDAWPNGVVGFHAIEAKLFGARRTDFGKEADELVRNLSELSTKARHTPLTPQGLLDGTVRLAYEVGESKLDGGESRVSGTSLDDMRNNVDGIELAWRTISAPATKARDRELDADVRRGIDELKTMLGVPDLRRIDPDGLRTATEELVLRLQNAAPLLDLKKPALEADAR